MTKKKTHPHHEESGHAAEDQNTQASQSDLQTDLQRVQAEFINYKRRQDAERADFINVAKQEVIMQILPLLDNIGRALSHRPPELKDDPWANGVEQVARQAEETLAKLGVEKIAALGKPFDHHLHEAIAYEEGEGDSEVVTEELQPGYKIGDKVIRHSVVKVGKR